MFCAGVAFSMIFVQTTLIMASAFFGCHIIDHVDSFALDPTNRWCQEGGQSSFSASLIHPPSSGAFPLRPFTKTWTSSLRNTKILSNPTTSTPYSRRSQTLLTVMNTDNNNSNADDDGNKGSIDENKNDKFSFYQRVESTKTALVGLLSGGLVSTPIIALHDIPNYGLASWEFDTDMGSLQSALFAIVYRYCIRQNDDNAMLNMGVVGAFIFVRTLARIRVPTYCTAAPLDCGDPFGYFDYDMIGQLILNGMESVALFGGAAYAMEVAYRKGWITKFP